MSKPNAVGIIGPSGNGKTTFAHTLFKLLDPKGDPNGPNSRIIVVDMSDIIRWGKGLATEIGAEVRRFAGLQAKGKLLPDSVIVALFQVWLEETRAKNPHVRLIIVSGVPRARGQLEILDLFARHKLIHIRATKEMSHDAIMRRLAETHPSAMRADDLGGEAVTEERWNEYMNLTVPMVESLGNKVVQLSRNDPLRCRLLYGLKAFESDSRSPIDHDLVDMALRALKNEQHQIHSRIRQIEAPRPKPSILQFQHLAVA